MATDNQALAAGFTLPEDTDWADAGAAAIRQNALAAVDLAVAHSKSIELVSGTITLDNTGRPIREFYCTGSATINGVAFPAGTAVVWRRTPAGVWGYIVVDDWTDLAATTTTTTTEATTTTTTTTAAPSGTLTYRGQSQISSDVTTFTYTDAPLGAPSANRHVIVLVTWWSGGTRSVSSLTIGGVEAERVYRDRTLSGRGFWVYILPVTSGTTADIVATFSGIAEPSIAVWTTDQLATFVAGNTADPLVPASSTTASISAASVPGGFAISGYRTLSNATDATWTNITERWDTGASNRPSSGGDMVTASTTATAIVDWDPALTQNSSHSIATFKWGA